MACTIELAEELVERRIASVALQHDGQRRITALLELVQQSEHGIGRRVQMIVENPGLPAALNNISKASAHRSMCLWAASSSDRPHSVSLCRSKSSVV